MNRFDTRHDSDSGTDSQIPLPDSTDADRLREAVGKFEELIADGIRAEPEEICPNDPAIAQQLRRYIDSYRKLTQTHIGGESDNAFLPETIGPYPVVRELARGGASIIYLVEQSFPRRSVALKLLQASLSHPQRESRFRLEVQLLAMLEHPNIAQIYDAGIAKLGQTDRPYFTMEWIQGQSIWKHVREQASEGSWTTNDTLRLCIEYCDAIAHAHATGIIHRDLKPGNLMVTGEGAAKVIDFGLAHVVEDARPEDMAYPTSRAWVGTRPYMSPEQFGIDGQVVDTRTDIYSMGVVIFQLLTDEFPYAVEEASMWETAEVVRKKPPMPLRRFRADVSADLETVLLVAMAKDPADRYQTMQELRDDLQRCVDRKSIRMSRAGAVTQLFRWGGNNPIAARAALCIIALFIGMLCWALRSTQLATQRSTELQGIQQDLRKQLKARVQSERSLSESYQRLQQTGYNRTLLDLGALAAYQPDYVINQLEQEETFPVGQREFAWRLAYGLADLGGISWQADPEGIDDLCLSSDGSFVVTSGDSGIAVWSLPACEMTAHSPDSMSIQASSPLCLDEVNRRVLFVAGDGSLNHVSIESGEVNTVSTRLEGTLRSVTTHAGSGDILIGDDAGRVELVRHDGTGGWIHRVAASPVIAMAIADHGSRFGVISEGGEVVVATMADGQVSSRSRCGVSPIERGSFSADLRWAACLQKSQACVVWNVERGQAFATHLNDKQHPDLDWLPAESSIRGPVYVYSRRGQVGIFRGVKEVALLRSALTPSVPRMSSALGNEAGVGLVGDPSVIAIDVSQDGARMACALDDGTVVVEATSSRVGRDSWPVEYSVVKRLAYSADGKRIVVSGWSGGMVVLDSEDGRFIRRVNSPGRLVSQLAFTDDRSSVIYGDERQGVARVDLASDQVTRGPSLLPDSKEFLQIDGRLLVGSAGKDPIWIGSDMKLLEQSKQSSMKEALGFSCADYCEMTNTVAYCDRGGILSVATVDGFGWSLQRRVKMDQLLMVRFTLDGRYFATLDESDGLQLWSTDEMVRIKMLQRDAGRIRWIDLSPDGSLLATGNVQGQVVLWDTVNWEARLEVPSGLQTIRYLTFSPDGNRLLVAGKGNQICVLDATP